MNIFLSSILIVAILWLLYSLLRYLIPTTNVLANWIIGTIALLIYLRFIIQFLNKYLDALVLTPEWISVFEREEFLSYKLQKFERDSIESIVHEQHSLYEKILWKGIIKITIDHWVIFTFQDVFQPHRIADILWQYKHTYSPNNHQINNMIESHWTESGEKFEILVETLGEVIKEYMGKSQENKKNKRDL